MYCNGKNGSLLLSASKTLIYTLSALPTILACRPQPRPPGPRHATQSRSEAVANGDKKASCGLNETVQILCPATMQSCQRSNFRKMNQKIRNSMNNCFIRIHRNFDQEIIVLLTKRHYLLPIIQNKYKFHFK